MRSPRDPQEIPKRFPRDPQEIPKRSPRDSQEIPKRSPRDPQEIPKRSPRDPHEIPKTNGIMIFSKQNIISTFYDKPLFDVIKNIIWRMISIEIPY
jgi:hypothetical protein